MLNQKKVLVSLSAAALIGVAALGAGGVMAQTNDTDHHQTMITRLSQKLGIEESKVKSAFDSIHQENAGQREQKVTERLTQLVKDGKLTETQKIAIIAKMAELKANFNPDTVKNLTPEQRKAQMDTHRTELENWAKAQGIDLSLLPFQKFGMGMGREGKMHGGR